MRRIGRGGEVEVEEDDDDCEDLLTASHRNTNALASSEMGDDSDSIIFTNRLKWSKRAGVIVDDDGGDEFEEEGKMRGFMFANE